MYASAVPINVIFSRSVAMVPNKSIACIFPDTLPEERFLRPLVQVFDQVVYLQTIEHGLPLTKSESQLISRYHAEDRLQYFTAVPLGEQRQRFIALNQDLQQRGSQYISQLGMLTLAGLNRGDQSESRRTIISDILNNSGIRPEQETEQLLWQSRLILQLAEMYDRERAGLRLALQDITEQENKLLAMLRDDENNLFTLPAATLTSDQEMDSFLRYRLRAWTRLVFHTAAQPVIPGLLITRYQTALDLLHEFYEKQERQSPRLLATLKIPATQKDSEFAQTLEVSPTKQCQSLKMALSTLYTGRTEAYSREKLIQLLEKGILEWSQCTAANSDSTQHVQWKLELYLFENISLPTLFAKSYAAGQEYCRPTQPAAGCVVGILAPQ